jgi:hypothetical protein
MSEESNYASPNGYVQQGHKGTTKYVGDMLSHTDDPAGAGFKLIDKCNLKVEAINKSTAVRRLRFGAYGIRVTECSYNYASWIKLCKSCSG